jgi:Ca-activated chloride channel family protein
MGDENAPLSVRITSPLGRTGTPNKVRIVAQIRAAPEAVLRPIQFYVDDALLKSDEDGPPYAVEWIDENPFERRTIAVHVEDALGHTARDSVVLEPFEIVDVTQVSSVLLEAGVYDKKGRFVSGLTPSSFSVREDGVEQTLDLVNHEALPATFALLIDSSQSMSRRIDFVRDAARRLLEFLKPQDRVLLAPFSRQLAAITGPTNDKNTIIESLGRVEAAGGTAIVDSLIAVVQAMPTDHVRRAVVLITDGYDENSTMTVEDAIAAVKAARVTVYTVGIGGVAGISLKGERLLRRLAVETGGQTFFPPQEEYLAAVHEQLAADAQNRYLITYTPTNQKIDGTWRAVSVTTVPDFKVQVRPGYTAPAPPPIRPELEFTITDANRRHVDLSSDDLTVIEDGVEQKIEVFQDAVAPVSIILTLDASGSMRRDAPDVIEAAREFVAALRPEDSLAVQLFSDQVVLAHDFTKNRESSITAVEAYQATGGTALYDALAEGLTRLKRVEGRRVIVVLTDGRDENNAGTAAGSVRTFHDVSNLIKESDATVFTVGLGARVDRSPLERLASLSGGGAYFPLEVSHLREDYLRIVENLRRRFVLSYMSTNPVRNGSWRDVQIRSKSADVVISSRGGYFAPQQ